MNENILPSSGTETSAPAQFQAFNANHKLHKDFSLQENEKLINYYSAIPNTYLNVFNV